LAAASASLAGFQDDFGALVQSVNPSANAGASPNTKERAITVVLIGAFMFSPSLKSASPGADAMA
jgi:hypothetical protein